MSSESKKFRIPPWALLFGAAFVVVLVALFFLLDIPHVVDWRHLSLHSFFDAIKRQGPFVYFGALALLPAVGFPVSPFCLIAGGSFGLKTSIIGIVIAYGINMTGTYFLARYWFRGVIESLLSRTRFKVPEIDDKNHVQLTLVLRVVPGAPFFVQNYLLGLAKVPFRTYLLISWPIQSAMAIGITVMGSAFYSSSASRVIFGVAVFIVVGVVLHWMRVRLKKKGFTEATAHQLADDE